MITADSQPEPRPESGTVLVADELLDTDRPPIVCPAAVLIAGHVQRQGVPTIRRSLYLDDADVHNSHVVTGLGHHGAVFVEELDEVPDDATVVFSAHGVSPAVRAEAARRGLRVVDATCPLVSKVHTVLVENTDDIDHLVVTDPLRVSYRTQTTLAADETSGLIAALRARFPALRGPRSDDICYATTNRQHALRAVATDAELDGPADIRASWLADVDTIGVTAGASAPPVLVHNVVEALGALGTTHLSERTVAEETMHFALPPKVRQP